MKLTKITQNKTYPKGFQVVYDGVFYEVENHIQGISIELKSHVEKSVLVMTKDIDNIYIYDQDRNSLRWLYRVEQLGELKKYRVAESKDSGHTWDFLNKEFINDPFEHSPLITDDLKAAKALKKKFEENEVIAYASRLDKWQPIK